MFYLLLGIILAFFCLHAVITIGPWLNKNLFSKIWHEERSTVASETVDRIKELMIDGEVSEETALLIATKENNETEERVLDAFEVQDAKELVALLSGKKNNLLQFFTKLSKMDKKGMKK